MTCLAPKFSVQNSALTGYARRIFQILKASSTNYIKKENILVFFLQLTRARS